jgi:hypothetical protein
MNMESAQSEIVTRFLKAAAEKWSGELVEAMKPTLEAMAIAVWKVESFELLSGEEPALTTAILEQQSLREGKKKEK